MFSNSLSILEALIGFGFLIFVHELGHFLACKWIGVRVEIFSLGFGPALKKKWGDTEYRLSAIPIGGFIKMAGEEPSPDKPPQPGDFYSKTVGQRAIVFVAGVTMNILFGFLIFMAAYKVGVPVVPAVVGDVEAGSPAWKLGLLRGDRIERIGGVSSPIDFEDLKTSTTLAARGRGISLTVRRGTETFDAVIHPEYSSELGLQTVGIMQPTTMVIAKVPKRQSAADAEAVDFSKLIAAGMEPGDVVTAVRIPGKAEPVPVATPQEFQNAVDDAGGQPIEVFYVRGKVSAPGTARLTPEFVGPPRWLGIRFGSNRVSDVRPGSWAEKAGLREGDAITAVGGKSVRSRAEVVAALKTAMPASSETLKNRIAAEGHAPSRPQPVARPDATERVPPSPELTASAPVTLTVLRDKADLQLQAPDRPAGDDPGLSIAFTPGLVADSTMKGYPAEGIGIQPGDEVVSANNVPLKDGGDLAEVLIASKGKPVHLVWRRDGKTLSADVGPQKRWMVNLPFETDQTILRAGVVKSCLLGARKATQWAIRVYATLRSLVMGEVSPRHLSGPLSIGYFTYAAARRGFGLFLYILGVLSVNLGVMNLLPIPVLDGGHLLFAGLEKLRGRPVHEKVRTAATYVGLVLIVALMLFAFWNDIRGFIFG